MALGWIPMNQIVTVHKQSKEKTDSWGRPIHDLETKDYKVRIDDNFTKKTAKYGNGEDVVFTATILFKGLVDVRDSDLLVWVDDLGRTIKKTPLDVTPLNDLSGRVIMTKVLV